MEKEYTQKYLQLNRERSIIFNGEDMPFFSVTPELSDLGESQKAKEQFANNFPSLRFDKACVADGAIIIQDIPQASNNMEFLKKVKELNSAMNITLQIVDGMSLTKNMLKQLEETDVLASNPVIILPGNGAESVAEYINNLSPNLLSNSYRLPTKRTLIKPGKFELAIDYNSLPDSIESRKILIIDDVVATGQTASRIGYDLKNFYPDIEIDLATWMYLRPSNEINSQTSSGIRYVDNTTASIALKGNYVSRPPINSLSCFLMEDPLSQQKAKTYTSKYARDPQLFKALLQEVKENL